MNLLAWCCKSNHRMKKCPLGNFLFSIAESQDLDIHISMLMFDQRVGR